MVLAGGFVPTFSTPMDPPSFDLPCFSADTGVFAADCVGVGVSAFGLQFCGRQGVDCGKALLVKEHEIASTDLCPLSSSGEAGAICRACGSHVLETMNGADPISNSSGHHAPTGVTSPTSLSSWGAVSTPMDLP